MIKKTIQNHGGHELPMIYCDFCGDGMSARVPEDAKNISIFRKEHHPKCNKQKNNSIDFSAMQDAP